MAYLGCILLVCLACPAAGILFRPNCSEAPLRSNDVCNTALGPSERAAALVDAMTIEEKVQNLVDNTTGVPRLGVPAYDWWNEALHGLGFSTGVNFGVNFSVGIIPSGEPFTWATSFANPILLAAAFDDDMVQEIAETISTEARAFNNFGRAGLDYWTPNINPYRDPRWGRGMETPGEDPLRVKNYAKSFVRGLEGPPNSYPKKTIATCKHLAGYDLEDSGGVTRHTFNAIISPQDLVEYYLPPFQQCARDSNVGSIMCSYNEVNGVPACANTYLLETILRDHWNWTGENQYVATDCGVLQDTYETHNYTQTAAEAASVLFAAGSDVICSTPWTDIEAAYNQSLLTDADIDRALNRLMEALVRLGYFDPPEINPYGKLSWDDVGTQNTRELARRSAAQSMVLLKNDGTLPLALGKYSAAVIGPWANVTWELLGTYFGVSPFYHGPLFAAKDLGIEVHYAPGPSISDNTTTGDWLQPSLEVASLADVVLFFGGIDLSVESEQVDRKTLSWSTYQLATIEALSTLGKPCVIIQFGDQLDNTPLLNNPNISAIVWAGYPGQDGGPAIFDVLNGDISPAGRLPVTQYPAEYLDQVQMTDMSLRPSDASPGRTYKFYSEGVQPFGYGLHYTNFSASFEKLIIAGHETNSVDNFTTTDLVSKCSSTYLDLCPFGNVAINVTNKGNVTSDFVALVFLTGKYGPEPYPIKELESYTRLRNILPGQTVSASLNLTLGNLARVDSHGNTVLYPGKYELLLDVPTQDSMDFSLVGKEEILDAWPQEPS
ncbi:glycoside hydrolase superfamily [Annulohypoxylon moriforme]|nr:glycoside hydrolase superfamily [Annulohypoxylon moriforme]